MPRPGRLSRPRRMLFTAALSACCTVLLGALSAAPAAAASASLTVSPDKVTAGGTVVISGTIPTSGSKSCAQSDAAIITSTTTLFPPDGLGPKVARNSSGAFQINFPVPASTPAGSYRLGLRCGGGSIGVNADLTITSQIQQTPSGAPTAGFGGAADGGDGGSDARQWLLAAVILAAAGAGFAAMTIRRRQQARA